MKAEVLKVEEHDDGGATYTFEMDDKSAALVSSLGLKLLFHCIAADTTPEKIFKELEKKVAEVNEQEV